MTPRLVVGFLFAAALATAGCSAPNGSSCPGGNCQLHKLESYPLPNGPNGPPQGYPPGGQVRAPSPKRHSTAPRPTAEYAAPQETASGYAEVGE